MVHVAADSVLLEIRSTRCHFALFMQRHGSVPLPSISRWPWARPLALHAAPAHGPFLGTETGAAVRTAPVAVRTVAAVNRLEYFCSSVPTIWTMHRRTTLSFGSSVLRLSLISLDFLPRLSARIERPDFYIGNAER